MAAEAKYDMTVYPTAGLVRSASDGAATHQVTLASCDCADFINRKGRLIEVEGATAITICKHIAEFLERVAGWHRSPKDEVRSSLTEAEVRAFLCGDRVGLTTVQARSVMAGFLRHDAVDYSGKPGTGVHGVITRDRRLSRFEVTIVTS